VFSRCSIYLNFVGKAQATTVDSARASEKIHWWYQAIFWYSVNRATSPGGEKMARLSLRGVNLKVSLSNSSYLVSKKGLFT